jgi:ABC-type multidrug transport system ATPase subunit/pSer/pThr/pTyr-binding forkhead associated (FHA) protein/ABC-type multidrug transport system permease subunit
LDYDTGGWTIEDLGSSNGTFVNGVRVQGLTKIRRTDVVTLGRSFPMPWPATSAAAPPVNPPPPKIAQLPPVGRTIVIGRSAACDVVLDFPMISSRHSSIEHAEGGWFVRDLGSTNGTYVAGRRIKDAVAVRAGDVIGLGSYRLTLGTDGQSLLEQDRRGSAAIEVERLAVDIPGRRLVGEVSLVVRPGELVGIMGPSGAGKSTLLAALAGTQQPAEGRVLIGGTDLHARFDELRGQLGYVPQDDIMHAELTVREALWYSARLRLPRDYSDAEIDDRITAVICQLGLEGTEGTRIGSADRRGISGGQRKRLNVAMELITDPPLIVLDEPTSGLSSTDAVLLMKLLRRLADEGKTILLTVHQPSVEILKLLNGVAVIARDQSTGNTGTLAWYGPAYPDAAAFFDKAAGSQPDADSILRGLESRPVAEWRSLYRKSPAHQQWVAGRLTGAASSATPQTRPRTSMIDMGMQCWTLARRMLAVKLADRWNTGLLLAQAPVIALLIVAVFGRKIHGSVDAASWSGISTAVGMTTFLLALAAVWFGCSNAAREIVAERAIFRRERAVGLSVPAYVASKAIVLGLLGIVQCLVLLLIAGLGCGLAGSWGHAWLVLVLATAAGTAIGLAVSAFAQTPEAAAAALPLVILPLVILGGSLLPLGELPSAATWLADAMPSRWAFEALTVSEAVARPRLEMPDPAHLGGTRLVDMAEGWFPPSGWRSQPGTPVVMLTALTAIALYTAYSILVAGDRPTVTSREARTPT